MNKILILANYDVGLYKFRKELIEELLKQYEVYISLPRGKYTEELEDMGCIFIETKLERRGTNPFSDLNLIRFYKKIMKRIQPDAVLSYTIKPNVYGGIATQQLNIPFIPNVTGFGTAVENGGFLSKITLALYKKGLSKAQKIFFQNQDNLQFAKDYDLINGNYEVIPGSGVNLNYYKPLDYPDDSQDVNFLFISRIMKQKGIDQYLKAAEYIKNKYPFTNFHILGFCEENYENKLKNMHEKGDIIYHGMQKDVRKFHEASHCTIHPTFYPEGMSNVLLETAASARPIITTNRTGTKEIIDNNINGYLIKEQNTNDLIEKIEQFIKLPYEMKKNMGVAGRKKMEKEFDRKLVINTYLKEIKLSIDN